MTMSTFERARRTTMCTHGWERKTQQGDTARGDRAGRRRDVLAAAAAGWRSRTGELLDSRGRFPRRGQWRRRLSVVLRQARDLGGPSAGGQVRRRRAKVVETWPDDLSRARPSTVWCRRPPTTPTSAATASSSSAISRAAPWTTPSRSPIPTIVSTASRPASARSTRTASLRRTMRLRWLWAVGKGVGDHLIDFVSTRGRGPQRLSRHDRGTACSLAFAPRRPLRSTAERRRERNGNDRHPTRPGACNQTVPGIATLAVAMSSPPPPPSSRSRGGTASPSGRLRLGPA